ncbi:DNA methyltransferase, partial [Saccharibacillus qingshengii]|uniref:DNA methyltransferase n=1 Tax=Saccharibacillus qingshengii TaxID=1763540 RepID=UPI001553E1E5
FILHESGHEPFLYSVRGVALHFTIRHKDKFSKPINEYLEESGQIDEQGNKLFVNPESNGGFHSDWLTMMYSRLKVSRNLLQNDGMIFISIDDKEIDNMKKISDEIFGSENFISVLVWEKKKKGSFLAKNITTIKEYILVYCKDNSDFCGLVGEINEETETYPCINANNKRELIKITAGISSKYKEKNFFLEKGSTISDKTMNMFLHSDLVIEDGLLAKDLIIEGNWRYSQTLMKQFAQKKELYITQDLYLRRIVSEPRNKALKDLLFRAGEEKKPSKRIGK